MKKIALALFVAGICATPSLASAEMKPYVRVAGGIGMPANTDVKFGDGSEAKDFLEYKSGYAVEGAVGAKMDMLRVEAAIGYQSSDVDKINFDNLSLTSDQIEAAGLDLSASITSVMANAYADFNTGGGFMPYLMGGIGYANVSVKAANSNYTETSADENAFAWQVGAGVGINASEDVTVDLGYRYFGTSDIEVEGNGSFNVSSGSVLLGVRYDF